LTALLLASPLLAKTKPYSTLPPRLPQTINNVMQTSDTLRILAIRVQFLTDTVSGTTGNGAFGSDIPAASIDPLPHNRKYFQDQLLFLHNFFLSMSNGKVFIDTANAVYPLADDEVYTLPYPMWHYNHNDDQYLDYGLAALFYDAWKAADTQNPGIDFAQFNPDIDLFIIFHAGVGKDFSFDYDPTPFDIPSAYIALQDLETQLPDSVIPSLGIPVDDGNAYVRKGMILPECENQQGYELGMHGHMALLTGYHLGMPNLYNTETGASVIGWFGMMDQGSGKLDGLIPAPPCPWTKIYMGWAQPQEISGLPDTVTVPVGIIVKIPLTDKEYFLVENLDSWMRPGVSWDSLQYSYWVEYDDYPETFALLKDSAALYMNVEIDAVSGVLTNIENWGLGRPASGLLIWHIDENVINQALYAGEGVNDDPDRLGVYIEEADGAYDIGQYYSYFSAGLGTELGSPYDAFWGENEAHLNANPHKNSVSFSDDTFPDAKSNSGAFSHLLFRNFSPQIADTMCFTVTNDLLLTGFPKQTDYFNRIFAADVDGDGTDELFDIHLPLLPSSYYQSLQGWEQDGSALPVSNDSVFALINGYTLFQPAVADFDNDGCEEIALLVKDFTNWSFNYLLVLLDYQPEDSTVIKQTTLVSALSSTYPFSPPFYHNGNFFFILRNQNSDVYYIQCWDYNGGEPVQSWWRINIHHPRSMCLLPDEELAVACDDNWIYRYSQTGDSLFAFTIPGYPYFGMSSGDIDRDGEAEIVVIYKIDDNPDPGPSELSVYNLDGTVLSGFPVKYNTPGYWANLVNAPALADIDSDGYLDISYAFLNKGIYSLQFSGVYSDYFPQENTSIFNFLLLGKTSNGEIRQIFCDDHSLTIADITGKPLSGFPFAIEELLGDDGYTLCLFRLSTNEIGCAVTKSSRLYAFATDMSQILWGTQYGDKSNTCCIDTLFTSLPHSGSLMPAAKVYNWPNPNKPGENFTNIRYYLNYDAQIKITIYDLAGDKVDLLQDYGIAQAYNETVWNLSRISSGVYFARVEASGGGQKAVQFIKIAVIK